MQYPFLAMDTFLYAHRGATQHLAVFPYNV